ncbi:MAG: nuclear transport factor 2 family protein [Proteobacteria bacterium]|nr:nuclear transport factor 2 family protein [Pseudomonadota bacterium]
MTPTADDLRWLVDRSEIANLAATYCLRVARGDIEGTVALFSDDCAVEVLGHRYEGHDGLRQLYQNAFKAEPKPFLHNHAIERIDAERARGSCVIEIRRGSAYEPGGVGRYDDAYVRRGGVWRFRSRTFASY